MCGVVGYIGKPISPDKHDILKQMLLESVPRGRDGWGYLAYRPGKGAYCFKDAVAADQADLDDRLDMLDATAVLMHVRAATSGSRGATDCHPLSVGNIAVVHNGVIVDHTRAREALGIPKDAPQVDSYLIPWIIAKESTIMGGIEKVFKTLTGSITFLLFSTKSPLTIWAASNVGANLYHFRMAGGDYLASSKDIFRGSVCTVDKWGITYPAFKESFHLKGVYEFSPYRIKKVVDDKEVQEWEVEARRITYPVTSYFPSTKRPGKQTQTGTDKAAALDAKIRTFRALLTDQSLGKRKRKRLIKRYQELLVEAKGFGADTEFTKLGEDTPGRTCNMCPKPATAVYQDVDLCWDCLQSFLVQ